MLVLPLGLTPPTEGTPHGFDFTLLCDLGQVIQPLWSGFSHLWSVMITPTSWPCYKKEKIREERGRPAAWVASQQTLRAGREELRRSHRPRLLAPAEVMRTVHLHCLHQPFSAVPRGIFLNADQISKNVNQRQSSILPVCWKICLFSILKCLAHSGFMTIILNE